MGETYLHVTSPEVYSKRFSDYVKQFHADDVDEDKKEDKIRRTKRESMKQGTRHPRRSSESSMLPPINVKTNVSAPTFANGMWSFRDPNSENTIQTKIKTSDGTGTQKASLPKDFRATQINILKDGNTKASTNTLQVRKSPETVRLSPIVPQRRIKSERKITNKLNKTDNTPRSLSKQHDHSKSKNKTHKNQKLKQFDEPFSIRRKIEQFKRWHEEQYLLKLQKLKQESEIKIEISKRPTGESPKLKLSEKETSAPPAPAQPQPPASLPKTENETLTSGDDVDSGNGSAFNMSSVIKSTTSRHKSAKTWRTWRDVNDSYAYTDVTKYIEDNELMTPEKSEWIKEWAVEVDRTFFTKQPPTKTTK